MAQDGHSPVEQSIYDAMYRHQRAQVEPDGSRVVPLGYADLSYLCRVSRKSIRVNVQSLLDKFAIEICGDFSATDRAPKSYRVLGYSTILERRRALGMAYIVRSNGGVRFCDAEGRELTRQTPAAPPTVGPVLVLQKDDSASLAEMLTGVIEIDATARLELIAASRAECASVRVEEIARVATEMINRDAGKARNLVGYLLTVVPRQFSGQGIEQSRARWAAEDSAADRDATERNRRDAEAATRVEREVQCLRTIVAAASATESERAAAARELQQLGR